MPEAARPEPSRFYRWMVLLIVTIAVSGSYYVYDALSPLADVLKQQLGFSDSNIGLLQAIYSFPNIFTVVIGGFIIDRLGLRKSLMIFGVLCLIGPAITAAAGQALAHGHRTPDLRHGRGISGRCRHRRSGTLVQRQRTQLRVRHQSDHLPAGFVCCPEFSDLGARRLSRTGAGHS